MLADTEVGENEYPVSDGVSVYESASPTSVIVYCPLPSDVELDPLLSEKVTPASGVLPTSTLPEI